jgi:tetratricopeptide (TPR) repeat protein
VVDAKADDADFTYAKRLVEACIRAGKTDDAQARIKAMGSYADTSPIVQLLISDTLQATGRAIRAKGDEAKAKSIEAQALMVLDKAVTTFPASAEVYMKRALFTLENKGQINDAMADANKSLQIRPGYPQALRLRAQIKAKAGLEDDAIKDLREALRTDVFADELRAQLMSRLIGDNRNAEAGELATEALLRRQNDVQLMLSFATLFANRGDTQRAEPFVEMAVKRSDQTFVALQALDFYLSVMPVDNAPSLDKAEKILERQKDKIATDPALLLARSQVLGRRGKGLESRRDAVASIKMIDEKERAKLLNWFGQLRRVMKPADLILLFDGLEREKVKVEWIRFFRSQQLMLAKETEKQGQDILTELMKAQDEGVRLQVYRTIAPFLYTRGEYQKAADAWLVGLKEFPKDWEMRNNLAFTFGKFLGKPAEGAEQSKEAAKILEEAGQTNADVYDTMGYCLTQLGKYAEAKDAFEKALSQATNLVTAATIKTHETEMHVKSGSLDAAKKSYQQAYEFIGKIKPPEAGPEQVKQMRDDLDAFKAGAGL